MQMKLVYYVLAHPIHEGNSIDVHYVPSAPRICSAILTVTSYHVEKISG